MSFLAALAVKRKTLLSNRVASSQKRCAVARQPPQLDIPPHILKQLSNLRLNSVNRKMPFNNLKVFFQ